MADIRNLLNQIAAQETQLRDTEFLAPCVRGGQVRTLVANITYTLLTEGLNPSQLQSLVGVIEAREDWD